MTDYNKEALLELERIAKKAIFKISIEPDGGAHIKDVCEVAYFISNRVGCVVEIVHNFTLITMKDAR